MSEPRITSFSAAVGSDKLCLILLILNTFFIFIPYMITINIVKVFKEKWFLKNQWSVQEDYITFGLFTLTPDCGQAVQLRIYTDYFMIIY